MESQRIFEENKLNLMKENYFISIVAPAYNEEQNIYPFYERIKKVLDSITENWEIVCVNDGSKDRTLETLVELHNKDKRVKVIDLSRNFGKEIALTAGLDNCKGDLIIPIDIDLQDPPELIPDMIQLWEQGYNVVYATRIKREGETFLKKTTAYIFYKIMNKITNINIPRNTGDFRLIDRKVLESLKELRETHRFMKGLFSWVGFNQVSLPYVREKRFAGNTKFNYWKLWNFALEGITSFSTAPLKFATYFGFLVSLLSVIFAIYIVSKTLVYGSDVPGYPSIMVTILFLGGIQLITIGIIGEYIGRIYNEVKKRPLYFLKNKYE
jgi:glycosyltransferase involved in cell wall biosynthesis